MLHKHLQESSQANFTLLSLFAFFTLQLGHRSFWRYWWHNAARVLELQQFVEFFELGVSASYRHRFSLSPQLCHDHVLIKAESKTTRIKQISLTKSSILLFVSPVEVRNVDRGQLRKLLETCPCSHKLWSEVLGIRLHIVTE